MPWMTLKVPRKKKKHSRNGSVFLGTRPAKRLVVVALEKMQEDESQRPACILGALHARKVVTERLDITRVFIDPGSILPKQKKCWWCGALPKKNPNHLAIIQCATDGLQCCGIPSNIPRLFKRENRRISNRPAKALSKINYIKIGHIY